MFQKIDEKDHCFLLFLPRLDGRWVLKSSRGLGGGWVGGKLIVGPYRHSKSVGLKGSDIPGGRRESIPVIPPAEDTGGSCGNWIDGSSFITRLSDQPSVCKNTIEKHSVR